MTSARLLAGRSTMAAALCTLLAAHAGAQLPGLPVLQNAFGNTGLAVGANAGSGGGEQAYALALGYGRGRFMVGGGIGSSEAAGGNGLAYGIRLAMPVWSTAGGSIGVAAFGGFGGVSVKDSMATQVPVGAAVAWRRAFGATRGISVHAAPHYGWFRERRGKGAKTQFAGRIRVSGGVDLGIAERLGATVGVETGQGGTTTTAGPPGTLLGVGVSWLWRRGE